MSFAYSNWNLVVRFPTLKKASYLLPRIPTFIIQIDKQSEQNTKYDGLDCVFPERMHISENKIQQHADNGESHRRDNGSDKVILHFKIRLFEYKHMKILIQ